MNTPQFLRFGPFELDVRAHELRKLGVRIRLPDQSFQLLLLLLERPGEVVQRADIRLRLWPNDTVVDFDQSINSTVRRLRSALDESADSPRYIETIAKRNYRFIGELERKDPQPESNGGSAPHYRLLEPLGSGGMGVVYRAEDCQLGRQVAVKFVPDTAGAIPESARRLLEQEARSASALNHPNICTIFGLEDFAGRPGIVMELLSGETLAARLARGPLPLPEALAVAREITDALAEAHAAGIVHRDLKPANVMLTRNGAKVMDFGLAFKECTGPTPTAPRDEQDEPPGTFRYMSPEQLAGKSFDRRTDIFSLGLLLYEMMTGRPPFESYTAKGFRTALLAQEPAPLNKIPPAVAAIVLRCLAKAPEDRWASAQQLKEELDRIAAGERKTSSTPSNSRRPLVAAAAAVTLAVIAIAIGLGYGFIKGAALDRRTGPFTVVRLTGTGDVRAADISPDGRYVAYVRRTQGLYSLWLKQPNVEGDIELVGCGEDRCGGVAFSPDGGMVYFTRRTAHSPDGALYRLPVLGGSPESLFTGISGGPAFAPDGRRVAFVRSTRSTHGEDALISRNLSTGEEHELIRYPAPGIYHNSLAWTSDGNRLVYIRLGKLTSIAATGGKDESVPNQEWNDLVEVAASPFMKSEMLVVGSQTGPPAMGQIFRVSLAGDGALPLTQDANRYTEVRAAARGDLVALQEDLTRTIQVVKKGAAPAVIARILFISRPLGNVRSDLWLMNADGSERRRVTRSPDGIYYADPVISPSGDFVVATVWEHGDRASIWRLDIFTGKSKRLTQGIQDFPPDISPDGRWVVYKSVRGDKPVLMKISSEGGSASELTAYACDQPDISPDGKWIACFGTTDPSKPAALLIVPFEGGQPVKTFALPSTAQLDANAAWTPDGGAVSFVNRVSGASNVWSQPLDGRSPYQVTRFTSQDIFKLDWSPKGDLVLSQGENTTDAMLILGLRSPQNWAKQR